jgi:hypothetical protein
MSFTYRQFVRFQNVVRNIPAALSRMDGEGMPGG